MQTADFKTAAAWLRARRTRKAIDQYLRKNPDAAIAYVNDKLAQANRLEEARQNALTPGSLLIGISV